MNDIKITPIVGWNLLFGASLVAIAITIWYGFLRPQPVGASSWKHTMDDVTSRTRNANNVADSNLVDVNRRTWDVDQQNLGSRILARLNGLAEKHQLQLSNFRTEHTTSLASLTNAPFVVVVDGSYPDLLAFVNGLESSDSRLAVNMVQITASDASPGNVTATLGLVGYRKEGI